MKYIYIDSNIWNLLHEKGIDLSHEFPGSNYELRVTGEQELENDAIPIEKSSLRNFILQAMQAWPVRIDKLFGYYDDRHPIDEQRTGGFNVGRYASEEEIQFINGQRKKLGFEKKKSKLYGEEADISLGARATHSAVLTLDKKEGPLRDASKNGGLVVFLTDYNSSLEPLRDFVERELRQR